jgi:ATP-binding cassette subfamily F protein uup
VRSPVKALSGGEKNRLLLAKMLSKSANVLIMDEPTNDLDVETLELLEDILSNFDGTLILVTHDREFMDNVVTQTLAFEGNGLVNEYVGGYQDWLRQSADISTLKAIEEKKQEKPKPSAASEKPKKLSYKLQLELDQLPGTIEKLEAEIELLSARVSEPDFGMLPHAEMTQNLDQLSELQAKLDAAMERWLELEAM